MTTTINDWTPETRSLLDSLTKAGFTLYKGDNGEETFLYDGDRTKFIQNLTACDEARLYVRLGARHLWIYLVFGNEPGTLASDYVCCPELDAVLDTHYNTWEGRKQPTKQIER